VFPRSVIERVNIEPVVITYTAHVIGNGYDSRTLIRGETRRIGADVTEPLYRHTNVLP
jgi:hypothetical protein